MRSYKPLLRPSHQHVECRYSIHLAIYFQLKFKRRVYKMLNLDEKQLKNINSRSNLKKLLEHVMSNNVEKVTKMCTKGLDPNFHCQDSGGKATQVFRPYLNYF